MIFRFPLYVPGAAVAVALVAALTGGWLLWKRKPRPLALMLGGVAAFAGAFLAPMLALDRVILDHDKLEQTTGFWWSPTVKGFALAKVRSVTIATAVNRRGRTHEVWRVENADGRTREIDPGDLWVLHGDEIAEGLRARGIEVVSKR